MAIYCLDVHAGWRCHQAGACCRAGWAIPIEGAAYEAVRAHFHPPADAAPHFITGTPMPEGAAAILATVAGGACVFYEKPLCAIHRDLGAGSMPVACQQFPRVALRDQRGTFVTLSHFCPTAARLLLQAGGSLQVVSAPRSLVASDALEGLDAAHELPPLLRPGVLTDLEGYAEWEQQCLRLLASDDLSAERALDRIEAATRRVLTWRPENGALTDRVKRAFAANFEPLGPSPWDIRRDRDRFGLACAAVPRGLTPPGVPAKLDASWDQASAWWPSFSRAARRFVAAHLFGTWAAYHGSSLITIVRVLEIGLSVLRVEAARQSAMTGLAPETCFIEAARSADLLLVHLADTPALVRAIETNENICFRTIPSLRHHRHTLG